MGSRGTYLRKLRGVWKVCPQCNGTFYLLPCQSHLEHCSRACRNARNRARRWRDGHGEDAKLPMGQDGNKTPTRPPTGRFNDSALVSVLQPQPAPKLKPWIVAYKHRIPD